MTQNYTKKDFASDREVRWCPGCGDYAILSTLQKVLSQRSLKKEDYAVISGIGCSSRFPVYMNTYGFHTVHGRAPTVATGLKIANDSLDVWVITGDGDGLSIGGNHLLHAMRKNINLNVLLFNNRIYGLTKGQYSPTSEQGKVAKSTPLGSVEEPINPLSFALSANASFVARTYDTNPKHMEEIFHQASNHNGFSFVEIFQNCVIFNDQTFQGVVSPKQRKENIVQLEENKPLIFGNDNEYCLVQEGFSLEKRRVDEVNESDIQIHSSSNIAYLQALSNLSYPDMPTPMGVFKKEDKPTYNDAINKQVEDEVKNNQASMQDLFKGQASWDINNNIKTKNPFRVYKG